MALAFTAFVAAAQSSPPTSSGQVLAVGEGEEARGTISGGRITIGSDGRIAARSTLGSGEYLARDAVGHVIKLKAGMSIEAFRTTAATASLIFTEVDPGTVRVGGDTFFFTDGKFAEFESGAPAPSQAAPSAEDVLKQASANLRGPYRPMGAVTFIPNGPFAVSDNMGHFVEVSVGMDVEEFKRLAQSQSLAYVELDAQTFRVDAKTLGFVDGKLASIGL